MSLFVCCSLINSTFMLSLQRFIKPKRLFFRRNLTKLAVVNKMFMIDAMKACIPPLDGHNHKGQSGRIGVIGGSLEYTGAPYFAAITAMKVGADLTHVFCASSAATVVKSYSPELIVHPLLDIPNGVQEITPWFDRLHAIVIGPGLGREPNTLNRVVELIGVIKEKKLPLVIDADGLFIINEKPEVLQNFNSPVILTPNKIEFERLCAKVKIPSELNKLGSNILVFKKGQVDEVFSMRSGAQWKSNSGGSGRRCGGQGDLLSGSIAIFLHWALENTQKIECGDIEKPILAASIACFAASNLVRKCNEKAFKSYGRSMLASNMVEFIHSSFEEIFGQ